eukprot:TRINITY_DN103436_c0_g1_i1.p1 TRINITY_DN103436_c0_g1~~TRINITY_DN103436_c0_g1_i1.p1  ORF type:complete len:201 (-),score=22.99 TRINITY_DN103436_c0_g1_i1:163-765(-)
MAKDRRPMQESGLKPEEEEVLEWLGEVEQLVERWRAMALKVACVVVLVTLYQAYRLLARNNTKMYVSYSVVSIALASHTVFFLLKADANDNGRRSVLIRSCGLVLVQMWMFLSSVQNQGGSAILSKLMWDVAVADFTLPQEAWPLSVLTFAVIYAVVRYTDSQLHNARRSAAPLFMIHRNILTWPSWLPVTENEAAKKED